jgi:hypothetical protein
MVDRGSAAELLDRVLRCGAGETHAASGSW